MTERMTEKIVELFDTTLRDGGQEDGIEFTVQEKIEAINILDSIGINYIEVGFAQSRDEENNLYTVQTKNSKLVAFGSTANPKNINNLENDIGLNSIIKTGAKVACIFGKAHANHVEKTLKISLDQNLLLIKNSVNYLLSNGIEKVIFDAEHAVDGFNFDNKKGKHNLDNYSFAAMNAAFEGGADTLVICDTNGGNIPKTVRLMANEMLKCFNDEKYKEVIFGIHAHNDTDCASANILDFVDIIFENRNIAHVQGTVNGLGERTGNGNLITAANNIYHKLGVSIPKFNFTKSKELAELISSLSGKSIDSNMAYVGDNTFAHKAGLHVYALINGESYAHIDPTSVGNKEKILISSQAGKENMRWMLKEHGREIDETKLFDLLKKARNLSKLGYNFNIPRAEVAVRELFIRDNYDNKDRILKFPEMPYELSTIREDGKLIETVTLDMGEIRLNGSSNYFEIEPIQYKSDKGPVNAIFNVLRNAISKEYPLVGNVKMIKYDLHIPKQLKCDNLDDYSESKTLPIVGFKYEDDEWATIGLHSDLKMASFNAILDGFEYFLSK